MKLSLKATRIAATSAMALGLLATGAMGVAVAEDPDPVQGNYEADFPEQETEFPVVIGQVFKPTSGPINEPGPLALPGGSWPDTHAQAVGATVRYGGTFRGVVEDKGRGTRIESLIHLMEPGGNPDKERGVYGRADWYGNYQRCYPTSWNQAGCSTAWYKTGSGETGRENDNYVWQYWYQWDDVDPRYNSGRGGFKGCIDIKDAKDVCTGTYYRGAAY